MQNLPSTNVVIDETAVATSTGAETIDNVAQSGLLPDQRTTPTSRCRTSTEQPQETHNESAASLEMAQPNALIVIQTQPEGTLALPTPSPQDSLAATNVCTSKKIGEEPTQPQFNKEMEAEVEIAKDKEKKSQKKNANKKVRVCSNHYLTQKL